LNSDDHPSLADDAALDEGHKEEVVLPDTQ
jgi:hypothetical protein